MNSDGLAGRLSINARAVARRLEDFTRGLAEKLERDGAILGLSGGVDSACVAALCAKALGPGRTRALVMPDRDSDRRHTRDALRFAADIGVAATLIDLSPFLRRLGLYRMFFLRKLPMPRKLREDLARRAHAYFERKTGTTPFAAGLLGLREKHLGPYLRSSTAYYRAKHRLRMLILYLHAERDNLLVVGAANKTEYAIGFFVKHGCDHAADAMPLLGLYKTQVRQLARALGVPPGIVEKAPSPDVVPGITDELAIGAPYDKIDLILCGLEEGRAASEIAAGAGVDEELVDRVRAMTERSRHMRMVFAVDRGTSRR